MVWQNVSESQKPVARDTPPRKRIMSFRVASPKLWLDDIAFHVICRERGVTASDTTFQPYTSKSTGSQSINFAVAHFLAAAVFME